MRCRCDTPLVFADEPETCQRCGRCAGYTVPTTREVGQAMAEIAKGMRNVGTKHEPPSSAP